MNSIHVSSGFLNELSSYSWETIDFDIRFWLCMFTSHRDRKENFFDLTCIQWNFLIWFEEVFLKFQIQNSFCFPFKWNLIDGFLITHTRTQIGSNLIEWPKKMKISSGTRYPFIDRSQLLMNHFDLQLLFLNGHTLIFSKGNLFTEQRFNTAFSYGWTTKRDLHVRYF